MARSVDAILRKHAKAKLKPHVVMSAPQTLSDEDWLARNDTGVRVAQSAPLHASQPTDREIESYASFCTFLADYDTNEAKDVSQSRTAPITSLVRPEPKSIHSPAGQSQIRFERPAKRRTAERNDRDCTLPADQRKRHTLHAINGRGKDTATITVDPFNRTFAVSGPRFRDGASIADKRS